MYIKLEMFVMIERFCVDCRKLILQNDIFIMQALFVPGFKNPRGTLIGDVGLLMNFVIQKNPPTISSTNNYFTNHVFCDDTMWRSFHIFYFCLFLHVNA